MNAPSHEVNMGSYARRRWTEVRRCVGGAWQRGGDVYERRVVGKRPVDDDGVARTSWPAQAILDLVDTGDRVELLDKLCRLHESIPAGASLWRLKHRAEGYEVSRTFESNLCDRSVNVGALGWLAMHSDVVGAKAAEAERLRAGR